MDVGTHDDEAAGAAEAEKAVTPVDAEAEETPAGQPGGRNATATATKPATADTPAEPGPKADEPVAAKAADQTAETRIVKRQPAAGTKGANPLASARPAKTTTHRGRSTLSAVGSGVNRVRNLIASLVWLIAVLAAGVLALGALFTALDQTNPNNEIVTWVLDRGHELVGPFKDLFRLETAKNTLLVNWGIAALVYLIAGKIVERFVRP